VVHAQRFLPNEKSCPALRIEGCGKSENLKKFTEGTNWANEGNAPRRKKIINNKKKKKKTGAGAPENKAVLHRLTFTLPRARTDHDKEHDDLRRLNF